MHEGGWDKYKVYELGEFFYRATVTVLHEDCGWVCPTCYGSGEGMADNTACRECKGSGRIKKDGNGEQTFEVSWSEDNLRDLSVDDGDPIACKYCGYDFMEDIKEELKWQKKHGKST